MPSKQVIRALQNQSIHKSPFKIIIYVIQFFLGSPTGDVILLAWSVTKYIYIFFIFHWQCFRYLIYSSLVTLQRNDDQRSLSNLVLQMYWAIPRRRLRSNQCDIDCVSNPWSECLASKRVLFVGYGALLPTETSRLMLRLRIWANRQQRLCTLGTTAQGPQENSLQNSINFNSTRGADGSARVSSEGTPKREPSI